MSHSRLSCTPESAEQYLLEAEEHCRKRGARLTPLRRQVLKLLLESPTPAKAYDLLDQLSRDGSAKPPTIYRSLEFLMEMGLAHRVESLNAFVPCGHWGHGHAAVFLICDKCGATAELHAGDSMQTLATRIAAVPFKMDRAVIEVRGRCSSCT